MGTKTGVNNENMKAINKSKVAFKEKLLKEKHVSSGEVALKVPSECPTSSTKQINPPKKPTPNFSKMHQKQFNNSKSIASFVERVSKDVTIFEILLSIIYFRIKIFQRKWMMRWRLQTMEF